MLQDPKISAASLYFVRMHVLLLNEITYEVVGKPDLKNINGQLSEMVNERKRGFNTSFI